MLFFSQDFISDHIAIYGCYYFAQYIYIYIYIYIYKQTKYWHTINIKITKNNEIKEVCTFDGIAKIEDFDFDNLDEKLREKMWFMTLCTKLWLM